MPLLKEKDREALKKTFDALPHDVTLTMFTQETECETCRITRELVEELGGLSGKVRAEAHDFVKDAETAKRYGVDKIPAILVTEGGNARVRFFGVPGGYEFGSLVEAIRHTGQRDPGLSAEVRQMLDKVDRPVHLQVMVTLTCPYCPRAVATAHRFAMASEHITADMVETAEFPHLAVKYDVQGVPKTIINETHSVLGAQPDVLFAQEVLKAIGK